MDYFFKIKLDDYLAQWFIHKHGGNNPVKLNKGSIESDIVTLFATKTPPRFVDPTDYNVTVKFPVVYGRNPESHNFLPESAVAALVKHIKLMFDIQLFDDLIKFKYIGAKKKELIYAWMETNGIEPTEKNWNTVSKIYQRKRRSFLASQRYSLTKVKSR